MTGELFTGSFLGAIVTAVPTIGSRLRYYRQRARLSQDAAAERLGSSQATISKWERDLGAPDLQLAEEMARLYGTDAANFFPSTQPRDLPGHTTALEPPAEDRDAREEIRRLHTQYDQLRNDMQGLFRTLLEVFDSHPSASAGVPATYKKVG